MALVAAKSVKLKPETVLVQALHDYGLVLTDEQKARLRPQTGDRAPDPSAVIALTVSIDEENCNRRSRCVGTRLISFLESVQQFTSIVDTLVSSHPEFAALIWGGVKLAMLAANNYSSYFDKLSTLLMNIGRTSPRLGDFGALYPSSERLQALLCEYYAVVVRLCKKAMEFSRRSGQFVPFPFTHLLLLCALLVHPRFHVVPKLTQFRFITVHIGFYQAV